jgi:hypothetical protein
MNIILFFRFLHSFYTIYTHYNMYLMYCIASDEESEPQYSSGIGAGAVMQCSSGYDGSCSKADNNCH